MQHNIRRRNTNNERWYYLRCFVIIIMLSDGVLFKFNVGTLFPFGFLFSRHPLKEKNRKIAQSFVITVTFIVVFVCANMCSNMIRLSDFCMESIETGLYFHIQFIARVRRMFNVHQPQVVYINEHQMCILAKFNLHPKASSSRSTTTKMRIRRTQRYRSGIQRKNYCKME